MSERSPQTPQPEAELREDGAGAEAEEASPSRNVVVSKIKPDDEHDSLKWIKLSACVEGSKVTITRAINLLAVADGSLKLADEVAKLKADAEEYNNRAEIDIDAQLRALGVRNV